MPCLSGHGLTNQSVRPLCQAEVSDHQRKHELGTEKQVLMDEGEKFPAFKMEIRDAFLKHQVPLVVGVVYF